VSTDKRVDEQPQNDNTHPERMMTTAQVADRLQLPVPMVRKAIRDGRLRASLPAGSKHGYRIAPSAVDQWLEDSSGKRPRT